MAERSPGRKLRGGDIQGPRQCLQGGISRTEDGCLGQGTQSKLSAGGKRGHSWEGWGLSLYHPASWATARPPYSIIHFLSQAHTSAAHPVGPGKRG